MRRKNKGETARERTYFRLTHLTKLRMAYLILREVCQPCDPENIPEEEYRQVMGRIAEWIERLE